MLSNYKNEIWNVIFFYVYASKQETLLLRYKSNVLYKLVKMIFIIIKHTYSYFYSYIHKNTCIHTHKTTYNLYCLCTNDYWKQGYTSSRHHFGPREPRGETTSLVVNRKFNSIPFWYKNHSSSIKTDKDI